MVQKVDEKVGYEVAKKQVKKMGKKLSKSGMEGNPGLFIFCVSHFAEVRA